MIMGDAFFLFRRCGNNDLSAYLMGYVMFPSKLNELMVSIQTRSCFQGTGLVVYSTVYDARVTAGL